MDVKGCSIVIFLNFWVIKLMRLDNRRKKYLTESMFSNILISDQMNMADDYKNSLLMKLRDLTVPVGGGFTHTRSNKKIGAGITFIHN
jgi:hypothetical protein